MRLVLTDCKGEAVVVVTVGRKEELFYIYALDLTKEGTQPWHIEDNLPSMNINGGCIVESDKKVVLCSQNLGSEPEILVMELKFGQGILEPLRIINLPDFKTVSSICSVHQAGLLIVGCTKHVVVFKEQGTKYCVSKILMRVFQDAISHIALTEDNYLITVCPKEGINITEIKLRRSALDPNRMSFGFKGVDERSHHSHHHSSSLPTHPHIGLRHPHPK